MMKRLLLCLAILLSACTERTSGAAVMPTRTFTDAHAQYKDAAVAIAAKIADITGLTWHVQKDTWKACNGGRQAVITIAFDGPIGDDDWLPSLMAARTIAWKNGARTWQPLESGLGNHVEWIGNNKTHVSFLLGTQKAAMLGVDSDCGKV